MGSQKPAVLVAAELLHIPELARFMTHLGNERRHPQSGVDLEPIHGQIQGRRKKAGNRPALDRFAAIAADTGGFVYFADSEDNGAG